VAQECIDDTAKADQVIWRTDELRSMYRVAIGFEIGPVSGNQGLTSVRQDEHKLQAIGHASLTKNFQRLSFERMMRARDLYALWEVLMVGSVWWVPSITYSIICC